MVVLLALFCLAVYLWSSDSGKNLNRYSPIASYGGYGCDSYFKGDIAMISLATVLSSRARRDIGGARHCQHKVFFRVFC